MSNRLSASNRTACLQEMSSSILDVLILGGGITGAAERMAPQVAGILTSC